MTPSDFPPPVPDSPIAWPDPARQEAFAAWLEGELHQRHGVVPASLRSASADASFRRYFRVDLAAGGTAVIMDAPPAQEDVRPFLHVQSLMARAGVRVPAVLAQDVDHGFLLLEDVGTQTLLDILDPAQPEAALPWYRQAVDAIVRWQSATRPGELATYDAALLHRELGLFPDWYLARHRGIAIEGQRAATLAAAFDTIVARNLASATVYVHRDFMPRNLMVPTQDGQALGVLDFQDAVEGPITYDIASLMRDAFLSWDEDMVLDVTVRYWEAARRAKLPVDDDFGEFWRGVEWMGLQRHLKVAGIFARLTLRDGKPRYLADSPRFIGYIRSTAARYRELKPLLRLLDEVEGTAPTSAFAFGRV